MCSLLDDVFPYGTESLVEHRGGDGTFLGGSEGTVSVEEED